MWTFNYFDVAQNESGKIDPPLSKKEFLEILGGSSSNVNI
jgi:hypothetical protein